MIAASEADSWCSRLLRKTTYSRHTVRGEESPAELAVPPVFQPIDVLAVERLLDGDVRHGRGRCRSVPVLLARREPDHVAGTDLLDRAALPLDPAAAGRDDEG